MYSGQVATFDLTKADFDTKTEKGVVLVDFWAEWCGPCKMSAPVLEQMSEEYAGKVVIAKVDVDAQPDLAARFGVMSIPTVILFENGTEKGRQVGFAGRQGYLNLLSKVGI